MVMSKKKIKLPIHLAAQNHRGFALSTQIYLCLSLYISWH